jgi:uncharacterized membrane protein
MSILIGLLYLLLYIAVILLCAALVLWLLRVIGIVIDPLVHQRAFMPPSPRRARLAKSAAAESR